MQQIFFGALIGTAAAASVAASAGSPSVKGPTNGGVISTSELDGYLNSGATYANTSTAKDTSHQQSVNSDIDLRPSGEVFMLWREREDELAPPRSKCSCCGASNRTKWGCSCTGGKSHQCLKMVEPEDPQAVDIRSQDVAMRWRRLATKLAKTDPEGPWEFLPNEKDTMLDDSELPEDLQKFYQVKERIDEGIYQNVATDMIELPKTKRVDLMEVCCPETRLVLSPPCTADCPIQNLNQKTEDQRKKLMNKIRQARRIQRNCLLLYEEAKKILDCHIDLEQPWNSRSWKHSPSLKKMRSEMHETIIHGCACGLRDVRSGLLMKKGWRVCPTDSEFGGKLGRHCSNRPGPADNRHHRAIEDGPVVAQTAYNPPALCKAWAKHILKKNDSVQFGMEIFTSLEQIPEEDDTEMPDAEDDPEDIEMEDAATTLKGLGLDSDLSRKETLEIEQRLSRLRRNLGHPSNRTLYKILKASGAPTQVLKLALEFKCHGCHVGKLPQAVRVASGVEIPGVLEVLASDGLEWLSPDQSSHFMTLDLDEGSGLTSVKYHGKKGDRSSNRTAKEVISTWESWCTHYRRPSLLRLDAEGCHCSQAVAEWTSDNGIEMWIAPGEAHWLMGKVERRIQLFKRLMTKMAHHDPECSVDELVSWAVSAINSMDKVGNHSPFAHALGASGMPASNNPFAIIDDDSGETQEQRRLLARKSYLECEYAERRRHAENARNRVYQLWNPGDLVYFWRDGKGRENRPGKKGGWYGPARVLVQEKRHVDGRTRVTSVVWISHGNTLIRCAPRTTPSRIGS
ncbi:unnamed protein product [Prorocentrum cordatum]|uniref:Integrase catalytic domain-containing protein n=1 Tax=Prorocentrum cordatum TaxID=2364126 RepID=A0ABN9YJF3_9DINO|nr:unnamed protein product [Polarella glacialis]